MKNNVEKEIENLTSQIDRLSKKLNLLKAKTFKSTIDLRANIKNELKAYIIQKILNGPESKIIFKEIHIIIDEILKEINFDNSKIKTVIKNEMIEKLKENFEFIEDKIQILWNLLKISKTPKGESGLFSSMFPPKQ